MRNTPWDTKRPFIVVGATIAVGVILVACGGNSDATPTSTAETPTLEPADATVEPTSPTDVEEIDFASPSTLGNADPEFSYSAMVWQGYWLSRDQFGPLTLGSGMGIPFEPPMDMVNMAMEMVTQSDDDQAFMPSNVVPLQAVYRSGDPALAQDMMAFEPSDFAGLRLDPSTFEEVVGVAGQAQLMLKESQWARNFHDESHFGSPESDFGAQQRFMGMMVIMLAKMQGQYAMENLLDSADGLYYDSDGELDYEANWVMLHALADIVGLSNDEGSRYFDEDAAGMFAMAARNLNEALADRMPAEPREAAVAVRALAFYAWTEADATLRADALARIDTIASDFDSPTDDVTDASAQLVALISAGRATGADTGAAAADLLSWLSDRFEPATGTFEGKETYSTSDVAWIIGGLNNVAIGGPGELRAEAARMLTAFYEATLDQGGMQLSAPPGKDGAMAGAFEKNLPSEVYYSGRNVPAPPMAGGEFGMLMLPASEIQFEGDDWSVTDTRFRSGPGMHLANELNWLGPHLGSLPFPPLRSDGPVGEPDSDATGASHTITAEDTAFDTDRLTVPTGEPLNITFVNNDEDVPHNLSISGPGGFSAKTEIFRGSEAESETLSFTLEAPGSYTFVCDVHPDQMQGTIVAE